MNKEKLERKIKFLEEDKEMFGLTQNEEKFLKNLKQIRELKLK